MFISSTGSYTVQIRIWKEWTHMKEEHLQKDREKWSRPCKKHQWLMKWALKRMVEWKRNPKKTCLSPAQLLQESARDESRSVSAEVW